MLVRHEEPCERRPSCEVLSCQSCEVLSCEQSEHVQCEQSEHVQWTELNALCPRQFAERMH